MYIFSIWASLHWDDFKPLDTFFSFILASFPVVRFQFISKLLLRVFVVYSFVIVVILEVEIKAACQVGSERQIDGLFQDVYTARYRLRLNYI